MNLCVCDDFSPVWPKMRWVARASERLGWHAQCVQFEAQLIDAQNECDWVLFGQALPILAGGLTGIREKKRGPWICWIFDLVGHGLRNEFARNFPWHLFDHAFLKTPDAIRHPSKHYLDQGAPDWDCIMSPREWDVLVVGTWTDRRQRLADMCGDAGLKTLTAGGGKWRESSGSQHLGWVTGDEGMHDLFSSAKCVLADNRVRVRGYWSDRVWLSLAAGTPCVHEAVQGIDLPAGVLPWEQEDTAVALCAAICRDDLLWQKLSRDALTAASHNRYSDRLLKINELVLHSVVPVSHA